MSKKDDILDRAFPNPAFQDPYNELVTEILHREIHRHPELIGYETPSPQLQIAMHLGDFALTEYGVEPL